MTRSIFKFNNKPKSNTFWKQKRDEPSRMWRPKEEKVNTSAVSSQPESNLLDLMDPEHLTEESFDLLLIPPEKRSQWLEAKKEGEVKRREHLRILELDRKHRYGDDVDILRATFTKTKEEIEDETFQLVIACRNLASEIYASCRTIPNIEKYVLGTELRSCSYKLLSCAVRIKKKYYRKNLLEDIDVELEVLRELYYEGYRDYPEWVNSQWLDRIYKSINSVGALVGALLKATVA